MSSLGSLGARLYRGEVSYDFIGHRKLWYGVSAVLIVVSILSLAVLRLTLGIEFRGGAEFRVSAESATEESVRSTVSDLVGGEVVVQRVGGSTVRAQTETLTADEVEEVKGELAKRFDVSESNVSTQFIGPSWGKDISTKALRALVFFLLGVVVFLSLYFEWKMALAAMLALLHDLLITAGLYSLVGFEVTPATVIGFLTILGYSLYDTVVVFDKVRENTHGLAGGSRMTYSGAVNLAVNQTLVRSINTSVIALLPIGAILFAGVVLLGAGPLKDLALALFIGVAVGAYSSVFIAPPLLAGFKEREPAMQALAKRVATRAGKGGAGAAPGGAATGGVATGSAATPLSRRAAAQRDDLVAEDDLDETQPEPVGAASSVANRPRPSDRRPASSSRSQRSQPRKGGGGKSKSKKRR